MMIITIDGPSGVGKSTVCKVISEKLNILYVESGALYRAIALKAYQLRIQNNKKKIITLLSCTTIEVKFEYGKGVVYLDGVRVSKELREEKIGKLASQISQYPEVREYLLHVQRKSGEYNDMIV